MCSQRFLDFTEEQLDELPRDQLIVHVDETEVADKRVDTAFYPVAADVEERLELGQADFLDQESLLVDEPVQGGWRHELLAVQCAKNFQVVLTLQEVEDLHGVSLRECLARLGGLHFDEFAL